VKSCKCVGRARCAFCAIVVREERGDWRWRGDRAPRRRTIGFFTGRVSLDGATVTPFSGPGPVALEQPLEPGSEVSYMLADIEGALVAERVKAA
jgi:hypothetical protein